MEIRIYSTSNAVSYLAVTPPDPSTEYLNLAMVSRTIPRFGIFNPQNRVPYYQRLFQTKDGTRMWWKIKGSGRILWPYLISTYGLTLLNIYALCRVVAGHKTFFGQK